jgi:LysW-gamma-L-lysine carboxypeptidase
MTLSDEAAVDLLSEMVCIPSLTGQEGELGTLLLAVMERAGFEARRDEVGNVVGTGGPPESEREVLILGHMDTVPGLIPVKRREGKLYGRGTVDAKGPLAAGLVAAVRAAAWNRLAGRARLRVTVIGAVQEEGPSVGAHHLADNRPAPDFLIIAEPSGWDALVMGYKGSQRFTVEWTQPSAHTAGERIPAPQRLVEFWIDLGAWCAGQGGGDGEFGRLTPTLLSMNSSTDGLQDTATCTVGLRLPDGITPEEVRSGVASLLPEASFHFHPGEPAVRGGKTNSLVAAFLRAVRDEGGKPRFKLKTGTSDMNVVGPVWGCPVLAYGPGDSRLDHTPQEHLEVEEYLKAIRILTRVLEAL